MKKLIKRFATRTKPQVQGLYQSTTNYKPSETIQTDQIKGFDVFKYPSSIFPMQ